MGVDLHNQHGDHIHLNYSTWGRALELAERHGWQPAGTEAPQMIDEDGNDLLADMPWEGNYGDSERQTVTAEDAANIAAALTRALDDIPDVRTGIASICVTPEPITDEMLHRIAQEHGDEYTAYRPSDLPFTLTGKEIVVTSHYGEYETSLADYFSGHMKAYLRELIAFCRKGAFGIH